MQRCKPRNKVDIVLIDIVTLPVTSEEKQIYKK